MHPIYSPKISEKVVETSQIEQITADAEQAYQRVAALAEELRLMRNAAFGPHPEAVRNADKTPQPVGAIGTLRASIEGTCELLSVCESLLGELRRIV